MSIYQQYADLKKQIKELTVEAKELEPKLQADLLEKDGEKLETPYATFSMVGRPKWKYSKELVEKESIAKDTIKLLKKKEEASGIAKKISDGYTLRCQLVKEEK